MSLRQGLSLSFLIWLMALVFINEDLKTSLVAARYLGLGMGVFLVVSRLNFLGKIKEGDIKNITSAFILGVCTSVVFGLWAHFLGGYGILQHWYSQTISSWVPGQTIPLYHETAGIIRIQGASSGPVEFAHLLLLAFVVLPFTAWKPKTKRFFLAFLITGIIFSLTRAVWLGIVLYLLLTWFQQKKISFKKIGIIALGGIILVGSAFFIPSVQELVLRSESTKEHLLRPLEVFKIGLKNPFLGNLGQVGPAARAKNLELYNDDKAPIAENIFIDIWAQTGFVGFLLIFCFWASFFRKPYPKSIRLILVTVFVGSLASIFDMTPLSICYFCFIAIMNKPLKIKA